MDYSPSNIYYKQVAISNLSGISTNTDVTPWGTLVRNGLDDFSAGAHVYITNFDTGRYTVSGIIPSTYVLGDSVSVVVSGLINHALSKDIVDLGVLGNLPTGTNGAVLADIRYLQGSTTLPYNGIAVTGSINTITLANTEPKINNYYQNAVIQTVGGSGANQFGIVTNYSGSTQIAYIDRNWVEIPDETTQYSWIGYGKILSVINPVSVTGAQSFTGTASVTGVAPINFLGIGSIYPGVTVSVTGVPNVNVISWSGGMVAAPNTSGAIISDLRYIQGSGANVSTLGVTIASGGLDNIQIEPGINLRQAITLGVAAIAGVSSGTAPNNIWYQGISNITQNRIFAIASSGIRSVVNYILPP